MFRQGLEVIPIVLNFQIPLNALVEFERYWVAIFYILSPNGNSYRSKKKKWNAEKYNREVLES